MANTHVYGNDVKGTNATVGKQVLQTFYDRSGIETASAEMIYEQFASKKNMPLNATKVFTISRYQHLYDRTMGTDDFNKYGFISSRNFTDVSNTITNNSALEEGAGAKNYLTLQKQSLSTNVKRFGHMIEYTDELGDFYEDKVQVRMRQELGSHAGQLYDDLLQIDMLSTNNVMYSGLGTSLATMGQGLNANGSLDEKYVVSEAFIRRCVRKLTRNRAEKHTEIIKGSVKISTTPIPASYFAIIGPEVKADLEVTTRHDGTAAWVPVEKYANPDMAVRGEVGMLGGVRFIENAKALVYRKSGADIPTSYAGSLSYTDNKFDVFPILFPTKDAFATISIRGKDKINFGAVSPKEIDRTNPYGTKGFFSYNFFYAGIMLKEECVLKALVLARA